VAALCNAVVAVYIYGLVPEFLIRFIVWLLVHSIYRLEKKDIARIPDHGAAILVCNHVSVVDTLVITAACHRPIRFVLDSRYFSKPVLSFVLKAGRAIAASPGSTTVAAAEISAALAAGELVAIFPEGQITENGELGAFQNELSRLIESCAVPVVPMALSGLWGSIFSRCAGRTIRPLRKIAIAVGEPLAAATPETLSAQILALSGDTK